MSFHEDSGKTLPPGDWFDAGDGHRLWWCQGGDPAGLPVLIVHGGPGGASRPQPAGWFDRLPVRWFALDQRGCGRSQPRGSTEANTLPALLDDMERLRRRLGLARWALAGGSWGARLALSYAARWPECVTGLMLRSPFLGTLGETRRYIAPWPAWLGETGRRWLGPDASQALHTLYHASTDEVIRDTGLARGGLCGERLMRAWSAFDDAQSVPGGVAASGSRCNPETLPPATDAMADSWRVHRHHALRGWGERDGWPRGAPDGPLPPGPVRLVWGAEDATCDPAVARALAARPGTAAREVAGAGHRMGDPRLAPALAEVAAEWVDALRRA